MLRRIESRPPANRINRLETRGRNQPRARVSRQALPGPALQRGIERVVHRVLGQVEVAEQADERGENATGFRAVHGVEAKANFVRGRGGHGEGVNTGNRIPDTGNWRRRDQRTKGPRVYSRETTQGPQSRGVSIRSHARSFIRAPSTGSDILANMSHEGRNCIRAHQ